LIGQKFAEDVFGTGLGSTLVKIPA
jgi:hypothetical protein